MSNAVVFGCSGEQLVGVLAQPVRAAERLRCWRLDCCWRPAVSRWLSSAVSSSLTQGCRRGISRFSVSTTAVWATVAAQYVTSRLHQKMSVPPLMLSCRRARPSRESSSGVLRRGVGVADLCRRKQGLQSYRFDPAQSLGSLGGNACVQTHVKHYYGNRLMEKEFWLKLLTGKLRVVRSIRELVSNLLLARGNSAKQGGASRSFSATHGRWVEGDVRQRLADSQWPRLHHDGIR